MSMIQKFDEDNVTHAEMLSVEDVPTIIAEPHQKKSKPEKRLLMKMDIAIVPLLTLSFLLAYLASTPRIHIS
jgi:hypothetical protein